MKVAELTTRYYPQIGGVELHVQRVSEELRKMGCDVEVFTLTKSEQNGVRSFCHLRVPRIPEWMALLPSPSLLEGVLRSDPNIIHVHAYGYPFAWAAAAAKKFRNIPYVFTTHSDPHSKIYPSFDLGRAIPVRACDMVIATTEHEADHLRKIGINESKIRVIPNGLDVGTPGPRPIRDSYILCLGRIEFRQKGQDLLLKAYLDSMFEEKLVFAGDGPDLLKLQRLAGANPNIIFLGPIDRDTKWTWLANADLVVIPSRTESFGLVALEAAAMQTPVVATKVGELQHIAGPSAILAEPNPASLSKAIRQALDSNPAHSPVDVSTYSWRRVASELLDVFDRVIDQTRLG